DEPQGVGWIGRAGRLLKGIPECPVHGYLLHLTEVEASLQAGRPAAAVDAARRIQDLGRGLGQPHLVAMGLNGEGRALIKSGHVVDGLKLLDEAMVAVLGGEFAPFVSGILYSQPIPACPRGRGDRAVACHIPRSGGVRRLVRGAPGSTSPVPRRMGSGRAEGAEGCV